MAIDLKLLGKKLKKYRLHQQRELNEIALLTGISVENLCDYENGIKLPTGDHILILSTLYHCDYHFFISNEKLADFERVETLYRRLGSELTQSDRIAIQAFIYLCENEEFLQTELNIKRQQINFEYATNKGMHKTHGEHAAAALRKTLGYKYNHPAPDVFNDFRRLGIHIFRRKLTTSSNISGLFINHPTAGKCVLINYDENVYRQRFSVCHEVAHTIFDASSNVVISHKSSKYSKQDLQEIRANHFASCYLMPKETLKIIPNINVWDEDKAIQWAKQFKVTTAALATALQKNQFIDTNSHRLIKNAKIPKSEFLDPELSNHLTEKQLHQKKYLLENGLSDYYVNLCFEAYNKNIVSAAKLAELLLVDYNELNIISELYGRSLKYAN